MDEFSAIFRVFWAHDGECVRTRAGGEQGKKDTHSLRSAHHLPPLDPSVAEADGDGQAHLDSRLFQATPDLFLTTAGLVGMHQFTAITRASDCPHDNTNPPAYQQGPTRARDRYKCNPTSLRRNPPTRQGDYRAPKTPRVSPSAFTNRQIALLSEYDTVDTVELPRAPHAPERCR